MSRSRHGKGGQRRVGVHKNAGSPETRRWEQIANSDWLRIAQKTPTVTPKATEDASSSRNVLDTPEPTRPIWMDEETFVQLIAMRRAL